MSWIFQPVEDIENMVDHAVETNRSGRAIWTHTYKFSHTFELYRFPEILNPQEEMVDASAPLTALLFGSVPVVCVSTSIDISLRWYW